MTDNQLAFALFILLWIASFLPAWFLLGKLVLYSLNLKRSMAKISFWVCLVLYMIVIVLPYVPLLVMGDGYSLLVDALIYGALTLGVVIAIVRIFFADKLEKALWGAYGYVYDGLNYFYPYTRLVSSGVERLSVKPQDVVLDLGCGTGNASQLILEKNPRTLLAADGSASMLRPAYRKLSNHSNVKITESDATEYLNTLDAKSIDKALLINVLYAVHDRDELWRQLMRATKDDAVIVLTSSDRGGSKAIIKEHLDNAPFYKLLHPKLIGVFIIDSLISTIASSGGFHFISQDEMIKEIEKSGGKVEDIERCYGGNKNGVNLMMTVRKSLVS